MAAATVFFYDYFLTLADEVSHVISISLRRVYSPSHERLNTPGAGRNHWVCGRVNRRTAFVDDEVVFVIFIAVCSPPQRDSSFLNGSYRTGTFRWDINYGSCTVSGIPIHAYRSRSRFTNPGSASYSTTFHQQVSDVADL